MLQALAADPAAHAAEQQLAAAQARISAADAGERFQITFNSTLGESSASVIQPPPSYENFPALQNTLTVPLPIGSKPRLAVRQAQDLYQAAQYHYETIRTTVASQVGASYFDLLRKQALLLVAQQTVDQVQRQHEEAKKRFAAGDVPELDVLRSQVPLALAQESLLSAQNDAAVARETLNSLLGMPLDSSPTIADVTASMTALPETLPQARRQALKFSPAIKAARAQVRGERAALQRARLYREPTVDLQAIDLRSSDQTSFSRLDTIQAAVTIPLSDGGLGRAQMRNATAVLNAAKDQVKVAQRTVLANVSAAYLTAESAHDELATARMAQALAQVSYQKTEQGYRNGLFPLTDVLNAQAALSQAQIAYTQSLYTAAAAANTLNLALTGGLPAGTAPASLSAPSGAASAQQAPISMNGLKKE